VTTQQFLNHNSHDKGLLKTETLTDAQGLKWTETENTYEFRAVVDYDKIKANDRWTAAQFAIANHIELSPLTVFPELIQTDKRFYEGSDTAGQASYTAHQYDEFGNVTRFTDGGDFNVPGDDVVAAITYTGTASGRHAACASQYLVGLADGITVTTGGNVMRRRTADFDCANGDLRAVHQYLEDGRDATTDLAYDAYGNLARVLGPANQAGQRLELAFVYDSETQTYPVSITSTIGDRPRFLIGSFSNNQPDREVGHATPSAYRHFGYSLACHPARQQSQCLFLRRRGLPSLPGNTI
jgi:hypothetical protein